MKVAGPQGAAAPRGRRVKGNLYKKLPYDTARDLVPVALGAYSPNLLVVREDSPIRSLKDFVALARSKPGKLNYASAGNGTSNHLTMEYFKSLAGIDLTQVPYKGSAPMVTDLLGGQVGRTDGSGLPFQNQTVAQRWAMVDSTSNARVL